MSASQPPSKTAVIVVNFRCHELIDRNISGLALNANRYVVVLVDNFSSEVERADVAQLARDRGWQCVTQDHNGGFGSGANAGAVRAAELGCETFVFLNPDACASADVIRSIAGSVSEDPLAVVTPVLRSPLRATVDRGSVVDMRTGRIRRAGTIPVAHACSWIPATCMAVSAALFARLNGFDESYFMYWEDVDFGFRAGIAGAHLVVDDRFEVVHDSGGTQNTAGRRAKSPIYYRYNCRNRLRFAGRHLSVPDIFRWLLHTPNESWRILLQGGRKQLVHPVHPLSAMISGTLAGIAAVVSVLVGGPTYVSSRRSPGDQTPPERQQVADIPSDRSLSLDRRLATTIAVVTYRRTDQLAGLLPLLVEQASEVTANDSGRAHVDVLIVDNDPLGGAAEVVERFASPLVRAVVEPVAGIAAARNRALDEVAGRDLVVFIDDDEVPVQGWLGALIDTYFATCATAVAGPVVSEFEQPPPEFATSGEFFSRQHRRLTRTGERIGEAATNNLLLDVAAVRAMSLRFEVEFGLSGGSDSLFTRTLSARGGSLVWCREATVTELVPPSRTTRRWLLTRAISYGTTDVRIAAYLARDGRSRANARLTAIGTGAARIAYGGARWSAGLMTGSIRQQAVGAQTLCRGFGLMTGAVGYSYQRYRRPADG